MFNKKYFSLMTASLLLASNLYAQEAPRVMIAPQCLLKNMSNDYQLLSTQNGLSLIQIEKKNIAKLMMAKHQQTTPCGGFKDVTSKWKQYTKVNPRSSLSDQSSRFLSAHFAHKNRMRAERAEPYQIKYTDETKQVVAKINPELMWQDLTTLSNFHNRQALSDNGVEAVNWVKGQLTKAAENRNDVSFTLVPTEDYKQSSLVMKIGKSNEPGIVIGAHIDTITLWDPSGIDNREPGADDDGSGSITILQAAKALLSTNLTFKKPIYFIWYAAEEHGLIGSQEVVSKFRKDKIPVSEVIHFDMTGYAYNNEKTMWVLDDYTNKELTSYLEKLITTYVGQSVKHTRCGYGCSDHASWDEYGFTASMATETSFRNMNKAIHSDADTMDKLSQAHMTDYAKLAAAFAVELAEPIS